MIKESTCLNCGISKKFKSHRPSRPQKFCSNECAYKFKTINRIYKNCEKCNKEFFNKNKNRTGRFCSRICAGLHNQKIIKQCIKCNKRYSLPPSMANKKSNKFCSKFCNGTHYQKIIKNCEICQKEFKVKPFNNKRGAKYCSRNCSSIGKAFWEKSTLDKKIENAKKRFEKHVIKGENPNDCWGWNGKKMNNGYATLAFGKQRILIHRLSYIIHIGKIPDGLQINHRCDNRICSNFLHLMLGTQFMNMQDMVQKGRQAKNTGRFIGEKNPKAKLSEKQVIEIKKLLKMGVSQKNIGEKYSVDTRIINFINTGKSWKHVTLESINE